MDACRQLEPAEEALLLDPPTGEHRAVVEDPYIVGEEGRVAGERKAGAQQLPQSRRPGGHLSFARPGPREEVAWTKRGWYRGARAAPGDVEDRSGDEPDPGVGGQQLQSLRDPVGRAR